MTGRLIWILACFMIPKGVIAVKFLVSARHGGPEVMGRLAFCLVILAVIEGLSDFGIMQAFVQSKKPVGGEQTCVLWTISVLRGAVILSLISCISVGLIVLQSRASGFIMFACGILGFIRTLAGPSLWQLARDLDFRSQTLIAALQMVIDISVFFVMLKLVDTGLAFVLGTLFSELGRTVVSYTIGSVRPRFKLSIGIAKEELDFSKHLWHTSILATAINQSDKLITAFALGPAALGQYQATSRMAQYALYEPALAFQSFLFPAVARISRSSFAIEEVGALTRNIVIVSQGIFCASATLLIMRAAIVQHVLGNKWLGSEQLLGVFFVAMAAAGITAIFVAIARGEGHPEFVKRSSLLQLLLVIISFPIAALRHNPVLLAGAYTGCLWSATIFLGALLSCSRSVHLPGIYRLSGVSICVWACIGCLVEIFDMHIALTIFMIAVGIISTGALVATHQFLQLGERTPLAFTRRQKGK